MTELRPRAALIDVLMGRAPLVGARCSQGPTGFVSPIEARVRLGLAYGDVEATERALLARKERVGPLLRAAITAPLPEPTCRTRRPFIVSTRVDAWTVSEALEVIFGAPLARSRLVFFAHPHALTLAHRDERLRGDLASADHVLPDGIGLRLAGALLGTPLADNLNGTDMLPEICARAAHEHVPLVLVGAEPGVARACADRLRDAHPGLAIPVVEHGFLDEDGVRALRARVRALGRALVLVGMGSPRQERFAHEHLADLPAVTVLTVGGLFDFFSGRVPRAPVAWRELGLEWLWRLRTEPRRLARRYLLGAPFFLALAAHQRLTG